jgi:phospholipid N-methyltransferase
VIEERITATGGVHYLGIERDREFCELLRARFPRLEFAHAAVENVRPLLAERGIGRPKVIVSSLPLIFMPTMPEIIRCASEILEPGGSFRTFTYLQSSVTPAAKRVRATMLSHFDRFERTRLVTWNFPPAYILCGVTSPIASSIDRE